MASVVLIHPWNFHEEDVEYTSQQLQHIWRNPPLGIVLLATELRNAGHDVVICDLERDLVVNSGNLGITLARMRELLQQVQPDFVGITIISVRYLEAQHIIRLCDEVRQGMTRPFMICVGNIHPTSEPGLTLINNPAVDGVFLGEADKPFLAWVSGEPIEQIPGVAFRQDGRIIIKPQWYAADLDVLPWPDWDFIDVSFYAAPNYSSCHAREAKPARSLDIITSRGCVYHCTFCVYNMMRPRWNSPEYVLKNIEYMLDHFDIDSIYFLDSSLGNNRKQLIGICKGLINRGLNRHILWSANMRSNQVNEEILRLMWEAGCRKLLYGFESGSQRILDAMKKGCTVEQNEEAAKLHHKLGFLYHASMILGFHGETVEDLEMTLRWLERVRPPLVGINTYVPLPGSKDYIKMKTEGRIEVENPYVWRMLGEVNNRNAPVFADVPIDTFWRYFDRFQALSKELYHEAHRRPTYHAATLVKRCLGKLSSIFTKARDRSSKANSQTWKWM